MMRAALPIFYCVDAKGKGILASRVSGLSAIPRPDWVDWATGEPLQDYKEFADAEALFKEMSKPPKHIRSMS